MKNAVLFSGSANRKLATEIVYHLGVNLGKMEIATFADSEKRVRIEENVTDKTCFVIASLSNPVDSHLVELCLIGDALKNNDCGKLVAVIPYYGYARQDKAHREGEGVSARVMAKLIEAVGFDKVITVDLHSDLVVGYFSLPLTHLFATKAFIEILHKNKDDYIVVSPDAGAAKRAQHFAEELDVPLTMFEKKRNLNKLHELSKMKLIGDVKGCTAIMVDDVTTSGSTLVQGAHALKEAGAKKVIACVTHADLVESAVKILQSSSLDKVYVTDSILLPAAYHFPKLEVVSLASILAEQIKKMF